MQVRKHVWARALRKSIYCIAVASIVILMVTSRSQAGSETSPAQDERLGIDSVSTSDENEGINQIMNQSNPHCIRPPTGDAGRARQVHAFVGLSVLTMETDVVLRDQTVLVVDGRITEIGARSMITVPVDSVVIVGEGKYLMPALADMHIHLNDEAYFPYLLAAGITTVRNMAGRPEHIEWRDQIDCGERLGPRIFSSGPLLVSAQSSYRRETGIETAAGAEEIVRAHIRDGYSYIKVHDDLSANAFSYLIAAARELNLPVVGHVPDEIGIGYALESGLKSIEHLDGYGGLDEKRRAQAVESTADHQVWNCPTLVAYQQLVPRTDLSEQPVDFAVTPDSAASLIDTVRPRWFLPEGFDLQGVEYGPVSEDQLRLVHELHRAGAPLLLGTDAPSPYALPGMAIHQELENFVAAGLSPHEALLTGTRNPATFLDQIDEFGTVSVGKRAELLLLGANPLSDIRKSRQIEGVFTNGQWHTVDELHAISMRLAQVQQGSP